MEQAIDFGLLEKINYKLDLLMDGLEKSETSDWPLYMNTTMVAKYLVVPYDTMARLGRIGAVKHKSVGSKRIYRGDWLDAYMER